MKTSVKQVKEYGRAVLIGALAGLSLSIVFGAGFLLREFVDIPPVFATNSTVTDTSGYPLLDILTCHSRIWKG